MAGASMVEKKQGPGATGKGAMVVVRLQPIDLSALDAYIAAHEGEPFSRPQAIRAILAEWLATHGFRKRFPGDVPAYSGPATDVIKAMEAAIKEHKKSRKRKPEPEAR